MIEPDCKLDHCVLHVHSIDVTLGPIKRFGARGDGISVYFRDPDGSLLEFISYST